jgi:DNA-binding MarR family transcriptional regulator
MSRRKQKLFEELLWEVRASQSATDRFDQAVADSVGLNRTDMRLVDLLDREGRLTAGELAAGTGLTTGAITTAIDRLERAGYARRVRDSDDRRRVYVELTDDFRSGAAGYYSDHARRAEMLYHHYTEDQLELLLGFVKGGREFNESKAAELEAELPERRAARSGPPSTA